jgi:hypothetical protein
MSRDIPYVQPPAEPLKPWSRLEEVLAKHSGTPPALESGPLEPDLDRELKFAAMLLRRTGVDVFESLTDPRTRKHRVLALIAAERIGDQRAGNRNGAAVSWNELAREVYG